MQWVAISTSFTAAVDTTKTPSPDSFTLELDDVPVPINVVWWEMETDNLVCETLDGLPAQPTKVEFSYNGNDPNLLCLNQLPIAAWPLEEINPCT